MKLTKQELIQSVSDRIQDDDIKMLLLEDISDSFVDEPVEVDTAEADKLKAEIEDLRMKYDELKQKYIDRFTKPEVAEEIQPEEINDVEMKEKEIVDVKVI